eukprot:PITA_22905
MEWSVPKDVADIRSFMGLAGYYRRFVEGFSRVAYPITTLQKKGNSFRWTPDYRRSFDQLKHFLTTTPIMSITDPNIEYVVCMDASKEGVDSVLMQEGRVVAYEYRKLKEYEENYSTYDLELTMGIHALKKWRHYLLGHPEYQKMIFALRKEFFWPGMKEEVAEYLAKCLEFQQVKAKNQHLVGLLHPRPISEWKWETISIDFITGLPKSRKKNDSIMVVMDKLSKFTHFILSNQLIQ